MSPTRTAAAASQPAPHDPAGDSPVYRHVVADTRRALTLTEIGEIVGAGERAVQKWAAGAAWALLLFVGGFLFSWRGEERYGRD